MLPHISGPQWTEDKALAPVLRTGYAVQNEAGRWVWSSTGPAAAGVVTKANGRLGVRIGSTSTWRAGLSSAGAPIIYGG